MRLAVLGTGSMGAGIAQVAAQAGYAVVLWNRSEASVAGRGLPAIRRGLDRQLERGNLDFEEHAACLARIQPCWALEEVKSCDFVLECVPEDRELKLALYARLAEVAPAHAIFASNTSSLSITELGRLSGRPDRFVGLHFFNPVPAMKLVELVSGEATSPETLQAARALAVSLGKMPIEVRDLPGFAVNRIVMPMINEAAHALMQGVAPAESIDACMKLGCNHPMGPLALADLIGLDVVYAILQTLYQEFGMPHYKPCPLIAKKVEAGWLGQKTGRGFYRYAPREQ
jgi:3-hydroxybutyryl-CoA dehydrogenase